MSESHPSRLPRFLLAALAVVGLGALALPAFAGAGGHSWGKSCHRGEVTAESANARVAFAVERLSSRIDATDEQTAAIEAAVEDVPAQFLEHRATAKELRAEFQAALSAKEVDAAEIERLRASMLAEADAGSRLMADVIVELADVLTPEQREQLLGDWERMRAWHK